MNRSGWRKPTPGLCKANRLAEDGEQLSISKNRAMLAVRRVAPIVGLKPGDLMVLDTLVVFTKPCDWEEGARRIVWPSNEYLVENTGCSKSAVKRHLRRLVEAGLIAYKDSSNGKRWGRRDEWGRITEAYGFDLSPLAARAEEFEALYASVRAERGLVKDLKRRITVLRRTVLAILESDYAGGTDSFWQGLRHRYHALLEVLRGSKPDSQALSEICNAFEVLKTEAEEALMGMETEGHRETWPSDCKEEKNDEELNPTVIVSGPHIRTTNDLQSVRSNSIEHAAERAASTERLLHERGVEPDFTFGGKAVVGREPGGAKRAAAAGDLTINSIMLACPAFADMAHGIGGHVRDGAEFIAVAGKIRPIIGISTDAWSAAQVSMSREEAAMAIALITDKYSDGVVTSPGGYLRGLAQKAQHGELHLVRSVFGRLNARHAGTSRWAAECMS